MGRPFLKWPGGKRWAAGLITGIIRPALTGTYFEPFLGGGAVFFELGPKRAVLSDINHDVIDIYRAVQRNAAGIVRLLKTYPVTKRHYYRSRQEIPSGYLQKAARQLYLNRTAFGGIYRLNRQGEFNVPYGGGDRTPDFLWEGKLLTDAQTALQGIDLHCRDFAVSLETAGPGDVVYCDPTYTVTHDQNGFIRYNEINFAWDDQKRLAEAAAAAAARGALVIVSNAHHKSVSDLYRGVEAQTLTRSSCVSKLPEKRREVSEYLFILRPGTAKAVRRSTAIGGAANRPTAHSHARRRK